jgi:hypothetical protein
VKVDVRSVLTCETVLRHLTPSATAATRRRAAWSSSARPFGIIAAQSIGEPGTPARPCAPSTSAAWPPGVLNSKFAYIEGHGALPRRLRLVQTADGGDIVLNKTGSMQVVDAAARRSKLLQHRRGVRFLHVR